MNFQTTSHLIDNIHTQLELLDNCFYNNIDTGLIQHPELCIFANNMANIINIIKNNLEHIHTTNNTNTNTYTSDNKNKTDYNIDYKIDYNIDYNINYEQLQKLAQTQIN
jgi:hypothetical protein